MIFLNFELLSIIDDSYHTKKFSDFTNEDFSNSINEGFSDPTKNDLYMTSWILELFIRDCFALWTIAKNYIKEFRK